jgi:hypothetical protein
MNVFWQSFFNAGNSLRELIAACRTCNTYGVTGHKTAVMTVQEKMIVRRKDNFNEVFHDTFNKGAPDYNFADSKVACEFQPSMSNKEPTISYIKHVVCIHWLQLQPDQRETPRSKPISTRMQTPVVRSTTKRRHDEK